jgi:hypothetical protein
MSGPRQGGPLTVVRGQARFTMASVPFTDFEGTVGAEGKLQMRSVEPGRTQAIVRTVYGSIDGTGTVYARFFGIACNYDFVWQK